MPHQIRQVAPSPRTRSVVTADGQTLAAPADWVLQAPGDAALSRRIKKEGPHWVVSEKRGRKVFSRGIWAPGERVERLKRELVTERADPSYERKLTAGRQKRASEEVAYAVEFEASVLAYLRFSDAHTRLARQMARAIAEHAVPVGSGTVARTKRISVEQRAEAATIAWMRHQTTAYDQLSIPRVKGKRREIRRMLAERSRKLLARYQDEYAQDDPDCPLRRALSFVTPGAAQALLR